MLKYVTGGKKLMSILSRIFARSRKSKLTIGILGAPNAGKTTLANRISNECGNGTPLGEVSPIPHETRDVVALEHCTVSDHSGSLDLTVVDTPGIATKIDYEDFIRAGVKETDAKKRAKEATKGEKDSIKWLVDMDCVIVVLDSTKDPYSQVNITIIGNLAARDIPVLIVGNNLDLKKSKLKKIQAAFPQYEGIGISAKYGKQMDKFYEALFALSG